MIPAVHSPAGARLRTPVEIKLKPGWRFVARRRVFVSKEGKEFLPASELPKNSKIVHKTPAIVAAEKKRGAQLSTAERELLRYLQVVLPENCSPADYLQTVRQWPCVAVAVLPPAASLPVPGPGI